MTPRRHLPIRVLALAYLAALIVLPVGFVFFRVLQHPVASWNSITTPEARHALLLTVEVVLIAVPLNTVFGLGVALIIARHRFPGVFLLDALVDLPLAISPVVVGLSLVLVYGHGAWLGSTHVIFTLLGIAMASAVVSLPYVVREVLPVLQEIGTEQEQAATTLGAKPFTVFRRITLPSIRGGLAYGVTLTTARVLGEFGAVSVVSGNILGKTQTLTTWISGSVDNLDQQAGYAGAVILAVLAFLVLGIIGTDPKRRRKLWRSASEESQSDSAMPPLLTASASTSLPAP